MKGASSRGRGPSRCRLAPPIRSSQREGLIQDRGLVFLGEMELALLLKTRAGVALTQDL